MEVLFIYYRGSFKWDNRASEKKALNEELTKESWYVYEEERKIETYVGKSALDYEIMVYKRPRPKLFNLIS